MAKLYHRNPVTGRRGLCNAKLGNCPFSSQFEHFETPELMDKYIDIKNQYHINLENGSIYEKNSSLRDFCKDEDEFKEQAKYLEKPCEELIEDIQKALDKKLSKSDLNELRCIKSSIDKIRDVLPTKFYLKDNIPKDKEAEIKEVLKRIFPDSKKDFPAKAVWENEQGYHIWGDDNRYLDLVYYSKKNNSAKFTEFKELFNQAQLHQTSLKQDENGNLIVDNNINFITEKIKTQLKEYKAIDNWNIDKIIDLTPEEAAETFAQMHIDKGCNKLTYTDKELNVKTIWFQHGAKEAAKDMLRNNLFVQLKVRVNNSGSSRKVTDKDIAYFNKYYGRFFRSGQAPKDGKFKMSDLNGKDYKFTGSIFNNKSTSYNMFNEKADNKTKNKKTFRFGEFFLKEENLSAASTFDIKDFKRFTPLLTGSIEINKERAFL